MSSYSGQKKNGRNGNVSIIEPPAEKLRRNGQGDTSYKIHGLCCADEAKALKRELGPVVGGEERLIFDLLNAKMTVRRGEATDADVQRAAKRAGLKAEPWERHVARASGPGAQHSRIDWWRGFACAASGAALVLGFAIHALMRGSVWAALTGASAPEAGEAMAGAAGAEAGAPVEAIALYLVSTLAGVWFVAPKAWRALRRMRPDMNLLMVIAIAGALILGEWLEAAMVAFLFALALQLEIWSVGRARRAIEALMELTPARARYRLAKGQTVVEGPVAEVPVGAVVLVRPGERIPLDGEVVQGETAVDQSPITGESAPVDKGPGDEVFAGTINSEGAFEFQTTRPASDTRLARILHLVREAQGRRAPTEQWIEKFALYYTPLMMAVAVAVAVVPPLAWGAAWLESVYQGLVILVIACPCALVISTPVSIVAGLTTAARAGVLIKGGGYLERAGKLRAVAIDKTGTLTFGEPVVERVIPLEGHTEAEVLARAAAMEAHSVHPLARAILEKAEESRVVYRPAEEFQVMNGRGAEARVGEKRYWIGSHRYASDRGTGQAQYLELAKKLEASGHSVVAVGTDDHICGVMTITDRIRPEAARVVRELREQGAERIELLTGDNRWVADAIARRSGVDSVRAELLPEDKVEAVRELRERYGEVAMVGDGVNDAPAMAESTLAVAMGAAGSDVAIETADVALMSDDLRRLPWLVRHSRRTMRIIKQNVAFALGLKAIFLVLAVTGLATLWMAIAADMGATLIVIANAMRLLQDREEFPAAKSVAVREMLRPRREAA